MYLFMTLVPMQQGKVISFPPFFLAWILGDLVASRSGTDLVDNQNSHWTHWFPKGCDHVWIMVDSEMKVTGWEPGCSRRVGLLVQVEGLPCWPAEVLKMLPSNHAAQSQLHRNCMHGYRKEPASLFSQCGIHYNIYLQQTVCIKLHISTSKLGSWTSSDRTFSPVLSTHCKCPTSMPITLSTYRLCGALISDKRLSERNILIKAQLTVTLED